MRCSQGKCNTMIRELHGYVNCFPVPSVLSQTSKLSTITTTTTTTRSPSSTLFKCHRVAFVLAVVTILFSFSTASSHGNKSDLIKGRICIGTHGRLSVPSNREHHYRNLRDRYINCTYVDGNLEITWIQDDSVDLNFLQHIREVTGYVLISYVDVKRIVLPRLQIIRGRTHFKINVSEENFALFVTFSKMFSLEMPALRDVLSGSVNFINNYNLCYIKTINWKEIITDPHGQFHYSYNFTSPERQCASCDKSCEAGCWGEGPANCQKFSKENCSPQCHQGRCFGSNPRECCHLFCAGGCTGPKQSDCLACRNFYDDGICTQECPPMQRYNPITYSWETNPDGKYAYGATCVKVCPKHLLKDNGACVRSCPDTKKAVNGECVPCNGPCPKNCRSDTTVHAGNIDSFKDCTVIEGNLQILDHTFKGFLHVFRNYTLGEKYEKMHPDRLEVFSTLKEVTGYINIQGYHEEFTNLSYFRNLEVIGGRTLTDYFSSLYIVKTSLTSLGLRSLKKINSGSISILENQNLCYAQDIDWRNIKKSIEHPINVHNNRNKTECEEEGLVCDPQCSKEGCWGKGPDQCLSCARFKLGTRCLQNCSAEVGIYEAGPNICKPCHSQCGSSCHGPDANQCDNCLYVKDGPFCVSKCPVTKYADNGVCKPCHQYCDNGCTGPNSTIGENGCNSCHKAIINENAVVERCLEKNESCPVRYYYEWVGPQEGGALKSLSGKMICRRCHPRCKRCTGYGFHEQVCQECTNYKRGEQCEDECPREHYADNNTHLCIPCHSECRNCVGPGSNNCVQCRNYKIYDQESSSDDMTKFRCVAQCPPEAPHKIYPQDDDEPFCSEEPVSFSSYQVSKENIFAIVGSVIACISILLIIVVLYYWKRSSEKQTTMKMTMALTGLEDNEPLQPTNVQPNLAKLRIVKEAELRKGSILGYGAFGTVHKGMWAPEGENAKIPVAIKVLRDSTGANTSKEFLEEAYIMASVEHPNLLQLLAVCMTTQMMLVTQLMPLGCLLDFVRSHKDRIGSKALLNWCTQIARGMAYLEEKRLVHRDLAARNVLVQTTSCVKITDFGLAKLLDINEEEYKAAGGKMPIKWLALECIQHRIFTHKSDVWAFGVTVWELLTYGGRPYEHVPARDVPELLEKGERLPQPNICTIDVYMIMIKCWMLDAESRPGFKELADDFAKMARDPGRYLVIPGDRFMRLPQFPPQESKDHIHRLTIIENSDSLGEADEYLQPKSRVPIPPSSTSGSPPLTPIKTCWPSTSEEGYAPQNQHNLNKEILRYAVVNDADSNGLRHNHPQTSRYCSDPLKMLNVGEFQLKSDDDSSSSSNKREAHVGTLKLDLPLDEDDYLVPSPQQAQGITTYVDLIGDSKHVDGIGANSSNYGNYPDFLPHVGKTNIDNPEYLMSERQLTPTQTLGIPTISEVVSPVMNHCDVNQQRHLTHLGNVLPQRPSEEESDHEYYNDLDRLQRELQPLRKSETTV